jgi:hypothetical protein
MACAGGWPRPRVVYARGWPRSTNTRPLQLALFPAALPVVAILLNRAMLDDVVRRSNQGAAPGAYNPANSLAPQQQIDII